MTLDADLAQLESERRIANIARLGVVSALDTANALVKVSFAGASSDWLPWLTRRAGMTRTWSPPRVGEQVLVISAGGDHAQGVVLPAIYQDAHPAPSNSENVESVVFSDGSLVSFDAASHALTVTVASGGMITINGNVTINGTVAINGATLTHNSVSVGDTHKHSGVQTGGSNTGNPV